MVDGFNKDSINSPIFKINNIIIHYRDSCTLPYHLLNAILLQHSQQTFIFYEGDLLHDKGSVRLMRNHHPDAHAIHCLSLEMHASCLELTVLEHLQTHTVWLG